jgi:hypothetical protein
LHVVRKRGNKQRGRGENGGKLEQESGDGGNGDGTR